MNSNSEEMPVGVARDSKDSICPDDFGAGE